MVLLCVATRTSPWMTTYFLGHVDNSLSLDDQRKWCPGTCLRGYRETSCLVDGGV